MTPAPVGSAACRIDRHVAAKHGGGSVGQLGGSNEPAAVAAGVRVAGTDVRGLRRDASGRERRKERIRFEERDARRPTASAARCRCRSRSPSGAPSPWRRPRGSAPSSRTLRSRRARPSTARIAMCPPSRTGTGMRLSRPRLRLIIAMRFSKRDPAQLRSAAGELSNSDRSHQLTHRCLARQQSAERLADEPRGLPVLLNAQLHRLDHGRIDSAHFVLADAHADQRGTLRARVERR